MQRDNKKRHVVSYENLSENLLALFNEKYPAGFSDYLNDLTKYSPEGRDPFYAVTLETDMDIYLVKVKVKVDDAEDIERWLEGEEEAENEQVAGTSRSDDSENGTLPDDNIAQYGGDDEAADA